MPKYVDVEDVGLIEFPDEFSDEQIKSSLDTDFIPRLKKGVFRDTAARLGRDIGVAGGGMISGWARGAAVAGRGSVPSNLRQIGLQAAMYSEEPPEEVVKPINALADKAEQEERRTKEQRLAENSVYKYGLKTQQQAQEYFQPNPTMENTVRAGVIRSVASTVPVLAGAALGPLGPAAGILNYAAMSGEQGAQEAIKAGHPELADDAYLDYAGLGAITEAAVGVPYQILKMVRAARASGVPAKLFGDTFKKGLAETIRKVGGTTAKSGAREFVQEGLEQAGQNVAASDVVGFDPKRELTKDVWENALYGGAVGLLLGGVAGVGQRQMEGTQALQSAKEERAARNWMRGQVEDQMWVQAVDQSAADNANRASLPTRPGPVIADAVQPAQPITRSELEQSVREKLAEIRANPNPTERDLAMFEFLSTKGRTLEQIAQKLNFTIQEKAPESPALAAVPSVPVSPEPLVAARDDTPAPGTPPSTPMPDTVPAAPKAPEPPVAAPAAPVTPPVAPAPTAPPAATPELTTGKPPVETGIVDTIAGRMGLTEFEAKGYAPEQVTRQNWIDLQRAERRRLGQRESGDNPRAPWSEFENYHEDAVKQAIAKGEEVDPEVLKDYPNLTKPPAPSPEVKAEEKYPASPVGSLKTGFKITGGDKFTPEERIAHADRQRQQLVSEAKELRSKAAIAPMTGAPFELRNSRARKATRLAEIKAYIAAWDAEIATAKSLLPEVKAGEKIRIQSSLENPSMPRPQELDAIGITMSPDGKRYIEPGTPLPSTVEPYAGGKGMREAEAGSGRRVYTTNSEDGQLHQVLILKLAGTYDGKPQWTFVRTEGPNTGEVSTGYSHSFWAVEKPEVKAAAPTEPVISIRDFNSKGRLTAKVEMPLSKASEMLRARESMLKSLLDCLSK